MHETEILFIFSSTTRSVSFIVPCTTFSVSVSGVDHQELVSMAESSLSLVKEGLSVDEEACSYYGG